MKKSSREDLEIIISAILSDNYNRRDLKLMLFDIRDYLDNKSSLRDIANFIHPVRKQGNAFNKIRSHVENFLDVARNSGKLIITPIYNPREIIKELITGLKDTGFDFNKTVFQNRSSGLIQAISDFLDGTKIDLQNDDVQDCHLKLIQDNAGNTNLCFCFTFSSPIFGALRVPTNVSIAMPFFSCLSNNIRTKRS